MKTPFKKVPDASRKMTTVRFRVSQAELSEIQNQAAIRNLSTSEYLRRLALHRRADVKIETQMILTIRDIVSEIRQLHAKYLEQNITPPEHVLRPLLGKAEHAIMQIANY